MTPQFEYAIYEGKTRMACTVHFIDAVKMFVAGHGLFRIEPLTQFSHDWMKDNAKDTLDLVFRHYQNPLIYWIQY